MNSTKKELLEFAQSELPKKNITTKTGKTVTIQALKGSDSLRVSSMINLDEREMFALPKLLVDPELTNREVRMLIDSDPETATEIFIAGLELSDALGQTESEEYKLAKKN